MCLLIPRKSTKKGNHLEHRNFTVLYSKGKHPCSVAKAIMQRRQSLNSLVTTKVLGRQVGKRNNPTE